jgi:hypothetical protein
MVILNVILDFNVLTNASGQIFFRKCSVKRLKNLIISHIAAKKYLAFDLFHLGKFAFNDKL